MINKSQISIKSRFVVNKIEAPCVFGSRGEGQYIFRELGNTDNFLRGAGEQAHTFGDLGALPKK